LNKGFWLTKELIKGFLVN